MISFGFFFYIDNVKNYKVTTLRYNLEIVSCDADPHNV